MEVVSWFLIIMCLTLIAFLIKERFEHYKLKKRFRELPTEDMLSILEDRDYKIKIELNQDKIRKKKERKKSIEKRSVGFDDLIKRSKKK